MSRTKSSWAYLDAPLEKNYLWSLAVTILPVIASFFVSWIIARWAGPQVIGAVSWAMAFATAALIIGKFGMELAASKLASEYGVNKPHLLRTLFTTSIAFRLITTLIVALAAFIFAHPIAVFFKEPGLTQPVQAAAIVIVCASLYEFMEHFLIGLNRFHVVYRVRSVHLLLRVILTGVIVFGGWGAVEILCGYCGAWFVAIAVYAVLLLKHLPSALPRESRRPLAKRLLWLGIPLAASSASVTIFSQIDRLMIGFFHDMHEVGQYTIARNVTEVSLFPAFAIVMTLRPALASRFSSGKIVECSAILRRTLLSALVFGIYFASIFAVFAVPLFTLVYSDEFRYAGGLMAAFIWVIALRSIGSIMLPALIAAEKAKFYAYLTAFAAGTNFLLNWLLIPALRSKGAVIATIISYTFLLIFGLREILRIYNVNIGTREVSLLLRTFLAGVVAVGLFWFIFWGFGKTQAGSSHLFALIMIVLQSLTYFALISVFRIVRPSQIREMFVNLRKTSA
jgi:O-antigen/teichoic acid export membrane protein